MTKSKRGQIEAAADKLTKLIGELGDSNFTRIAIGHVEEAIVWSAQHIIAGTTEQSIRRLLLDIFDRIAAAIAAKASGDNAAYDEHLAAIDDHLQKVDASDADEQTRLGNIEAGLSKVADAVNPPAPPSDGGAPTS